MGDLTVAAQSVPRIVDGTATAWDYLNLLPIAGYAFGKMGRAAGKWGCFVGGTEVVMAGL